MTTIQRTHRQSQTHHPIHAEAAAEVHKPAEGAAAAAEGHVGGAAAEPARAKGGAAPAVLRANLQEHGDRMRAGLTARLDGKVGPEVGAAAGLGLSAGVEGVPQERGVLDRIRDGATAVKDTIVDGARSLGDRFEANKEESRRKSVETLRTMQEGDKFTLSGKGGGSIRGVGIDQEMTMEVEKKDGKYVVSQTLGEGASYGKDGMKVGAGGKFKREFTADTPEEAQAIREAISRQTTQGLKCEVRMLRQDEIDQQKADADLLSKHTSAVTISGAGAVEAAKAMGVKFGKSTDVSTATGSVKLGDEVAMTINYKDGKPSTVDFSNSTSLEVAGNLGLKVGKENENKETNGGGFSVPGVKGKGQVTEKITMDIPDGISSDELLTNPSGAVGDRLETMRKSAKTEVRVDVEYALGGKSGRDTSVTFTPSGDPARDNAVLQHALTGDENALRADGQRVDVKAKTETWEKEGIDTTWGIDIGIASYEGSFENTRKRVTSRQELERKNVELGTSPIALA